jgi:protein-disulfide isomerase
VWVTADAAAAAEADTAAMRRRVLVFGSAAVAVAVAAALVAVFAFGSSGTPTPASVTGAGRVQALLHGIPQHGTALGSSSAPVTLVEFADPQCPYCGMWERDALPTIVDRYVRPGKVRVVFQGMAFVGPDSVTALRTALAAARQGHFWNVIELLYDNQGTENTGWVTDSLLRGIGGAVPGLDIDRMLADRTSNAVDEAMARSAAVARSAGVNSTPTFGIARGSGRVQLLHVPDLTAAALIPTLDAALKQ